MTQLHSNPPMTLYKYRGDVGRDVECLMAKRRLYLASPLKLNDPFDCNPRVIIPKVDNLEGFIEREVAKAPLGSDVVDIRNRVRLLMTSDAHLRSFANEFHREDLGQIGILSLSSPRDHPLLWAHYADNGRGFSVGYRAQTDGDFEALGAAPVIYSDYRPIQSPFEETDWYEVLHTKSKHWSYEEEWRFVRLKEEGGHGMIEVPPKSIVEVCLGPRMSEFDQSIVVDAARSLPDQPTIYRVHLDSNSFGLHFVEIM